MECGHLKSLFFVVPVKSERAFDVVVFGDREDEAVHQAHAKLIEQEETAQVLVVIKMSNKCTMWNKNRSLLTTHMNAGVNDTGKGSK